MRPSKRLKALRTPDRVGVPFGDLMGDDEAMERFLNRTRHDMWRVEVMKREEITRRHPMPKAKFKKMLEAIKNAEDDDKPLRESISTVW